MPSVLKQQARSAFSGGSKPSDLNAQVVEESVFGKQQESLNQLESGSLRAAPTSIFDIFPDHTQPRRQIPSMIRQQWVGNDTGELFGRWVNEAALESGTDFDGMSRYIRQIMNGEETLAAEAYQGEDGTRTMHLGVLGKSLMAVVMLAAEIRRDGLTNPITVLRFGPQSRIDTGERRWLAYHLLNLTYGGTAWSKIPAREVARPSVWRQASENTARRQLNAIGMARQLALLIMDLYRQQGAAFMEYDDFEHDRHFYAQVADGNVWRIPRGKGETLLNAMDLKDPTQLRKYRRLLSLPDEVWEAADDLGWALDNLNDMQERAGDENHLLQLAALKADMDGYTVRIRTVWDEDEGEPFAEPAPQPTELPAGDQPVQDASPVAEPATEAAVPPPPPQPPQTVPPSRPAASMPQAAVPPHRDPGQGAVSSTAASASPSHPSPVEIDRRERVAVKQVTDLVDQMRFSVKRMKTLKLTSAGHRNQLGSNLQEARRLLNDVEKSFLDGGE